MRVLHTYCLNYNIGDYALGIGVKNLLREYLNVDFICETNIQGQYFDEYYINEVVNKKYDLLIIGGGGIIHGSHWPNGWFWLIEKDLIKTIKIPFIVYGVGNNYFEDEVIPQKAIIHLKETFNNSLFFSVRNDGSYKRVFEQVGINPFVVPDPGFHVNLNTNYPRLVNKPYVMLQVANDKTDQRFKGEERYFTFIESMRRIVKLISQKYMVLLAPHVFNDIELSKVISENIENCTIWNFGSYAFDHSDKAVSYYKYAEFVIAMRGHGQIIPIGFNTPVIALSNHPKHFGLMKELELEEYCISILDDQFEEKVIQKISTVVNDNYKAKLKQLNNDLFTTTQKAFDEIKLRLKYGKTN